MADDKERGLYHKYNVTRTDGHDRYPGDKHYGCEYFVLDLTHDKHARAALLAYADSCCAEFPRLSEDLLFKALGMEKQKSDCHRLDTHERVLFYENDFYPLSNFSAFRVRIAGMYFDTSEQAYHYHKFPDSKGHRHAIVTAISAHDAFKYAESHKEDRRPDWDSVKLEIMRGILRAKVEQHEYVRRKLLATGNRELIEDSWRDEFWGWGPNRCGQNMLGKLWMEIRAELRNSKPL